MQIHQQIFLFFGRNSYTIFLMMPSFLPYICSEFSALDPSYNYLDLTIGFAVSGFGLSLAKYITGVFGSPQSAYFLTSLGNGLMFYLLTVVRSSGLFHLCFLGLGALYRIQETALQSHFHLRGGNDLSGRAGGEVTAVLLVILAQRKLGGFDSSNLGAEYRATFASFALSVALAFAAMGFFSFLCFGEVASPQAQNLRSSLIHLEDTSTPATQNTLRASLQILNPPLQNQPHQQNKDIKAEFPPAPRVTGSQGRILAELFLRLCVHTSTIAGFNFFKFFGASTGAADSKLTYLFCGIILVQAGYKLFIPKNLRLPEASSVPCVIAVICLILLSVLGSLALPSLALFPLVALAFFEINSVNFKNNQFFQEQAAEIQLIAANIIGAAVVQVFYQDGRILEIMLVLAGATTIAAVARIFS